MHLCDCHNGATCSPVNGTCFCKPGWRGEKCERLCDEGTYGENCSEKCTCADGITCDPSDGECVCPLGRHGGNCEFG